MRTRITNTRARDCEEKISFKMTLTKGHVKKQNGWLIYAFARTFHTTNLHIIYIYVKYTTSWSICWKNQLNSSRIDRVINILIFWSKLPLIWPYMERKTCARVLKIHVLKIVKKKILLKWSHERTREENKMVDLFTHLRELSTQQTLI